MKRTGRHCGVGVSDGGILFVLAMLPIGFGCAGTTAYRQGKEAEKRGEAHIAYAYYAKAAQSNPDDGDYARSLKRLGPTAANFWINNARLADAEGRGVDAWKACMRCLMIQPDHRDGLSYIQKLETKYGSKLAAVKRDWQSKGAAILAIKVPQRAPKQVATTRTTTPQISNAGPTARRGNLAAPNQPKSVTKPRRQSPSPTKTTPTQTPRPTNRQGVAPPPKSNVANATPSVARSSNRYILSRDDDQYRERVKAIDNLIIELRDTSDELEADLDLYDGKRRIQKIRELKVGRSKLLLSPQNRWFRLSLERVDHKSETVAFRLDPA